jgi:signal transduction histidine kinase
MPQLLAAQEESPAAAGTSPADDLATFQAELMARIADQLLTPLTCIVGYADLLLEDLAGVGDGAQRAFLETIARNADVFRSRFFALLDTA